MNETIIIVYNNKKVKLLYYNLIIIVLEAIIYIKKAKRYNLVFKIAIPSLEKYFQLIIFLNLYLMIYICQIKLDKIISIV